MKSLRTEPSEGDVVARGTGEREGERDGGREGGYSPEWFPINAHCLLYVMEKVRRRLSDYALHPQPGLMATQEVLKGYH